MFNQVPYMTAANIIPSGNIATGTTSILGKINWSTLLSNAQKTLNVVNQAVPLYYQVKPVFKNIRAISKIGKEFSKISNNNINDNNLNTVISSQNNNTNRYKNINDNVYYDGQDVPTPTFFI